MEGLEYIPIFNYYRDEWSSKGAFKVLCDTYVTDDSGVGIVHQAPAFGEDDFRVCKSYGIVSEEYPMPCPIDEAGRFTDPVVEFKGTYVKTADKDIMKYIKSIGRMVKQGTIHHSYPFCWR